MKKQIQGSSMGQPVALIIFIRKEKYALFLEGEAA